MFYFATCYYKQEGRNNPREKAGDEHMDLLHLKYFREVAECQSITNAAKKLYVAQPYLSTKIRELEAELGIELFERRNRRIFLSEAGSVFLEHVKRIDLELETAITRMDQMKHFSEDYERLVVAASSCGLFQPTILKYNEEVSKVAVSHLVMSNRKIFERLEEDRIEFGLACTPPSIADLDFAPIFVEEIVVLMRSELHPELGEECSLEQLRHDKVMICSLMLDEEHLVYVCQQAGYTPQIDFSTNEVTPSHIGSLGFDDHIMFVPLHCLDMMVDQLEMLNLKVVHLREYFATLTWGLVFHKTAVFTREKTRFFKFVDHEMSAKGTQLAAEYGAIKNYCIPKKDVEREF